MPDETYTLTANQRAELDSRLQSVQQRLENIEVDCGKSNDITSANNELEICLTLLGSLVEN